MLPEVLAPVLLLFCPSAWSQTASTFTIAAYTQMAIEISPEVRSAREGYNTADAAYKAQFSAMTLPTLSFTGSAYPYGYNPANSYRFQTWRLNRSDMSFNTTLNMNLFNSFQDLQRVRSAARARETSERSLRAASQDRAFQAIADFYQLNAKAQLLEVARANLQAQNDQYKQALDLYRNGMLSQADVLKSETDWRSSQLRLVAAEADRKRALADFNILIDRPGLEPALLSVELAPGATDLPRVEGDLAKAVLRRPEVLRARSELERANVAAEQALQGVLPALRVDATWNRNDTATYGLPNSSLGIRNPNYYGAVALSLPFNFNLFTQAYAYVGARSDRRRAEEGLSAALRQVRQDIYGAYISLEQATLSYGVSAQKEDIARRTFELVSGQYRQGAADAIRMNQAQTDYLNAQVERTLALHDIFINRAQYKRAAGEPLW